MGLSGTELLVVAAAAAYLLGPKEVRPLARAAGQATGRAVRLMHEARGNLEQLWKESEVAEITKDLTTDISKLQAIRAELRGGLSLTDPGPLAKRVLAAGGRGGEAGPTGGTGPPDSKASPKPTPPPPPPAGRAGPSGRNAAAGSGSGMDNYLPFSARDVGMGAYGGGGAKAGPRGASGADIFEEAIAEGIMAKRAKEWLEQNPPGSAGERAAAAAATRAPGGKEPG